MKSWPLKWRVSFLVCLFLIFTIITVFTVAYIELRESLLRNIDPMLRAMAKGIITELDEPDSNETHQTEFRSITGYTDQRYSNLYRIWLDESDKDLYADYLSADSNDKLLANLSPNNRPEVGEFAFFNLDHKTYRYRAIWVRHISEGGVVNVAVAGSSHYVYHEMEEFLQLLLILGQAWW